MHTYPRRFDHVHVSKIHYLTWIHAHPSGNSIDVAGSRTCEADRLCDMDVPSVVWRCHTYSFYDKKSSYRGRSNNGYARTINVARERHDKRMRMIDDATTDGACE